VILAVPAVSRQPVCGGAEHLDRFTKPIPRTTTTTRPSRSPPLLLLPLPAVLPAVPSSLQLLLLLPIGQQRLRRLPVTIPGSQLRSPNRRRVHRRSSTEQQCTDHSWVIRFRRTVMDRHAAAGIRQQQIQTASITAAAALAGACCRRRLAPAAAAGGAR
jgi:hypothetical protein